MIPYDVSSRGELAEPENLQNPMEDLISSVTALYALYIIAALMVGFGLFLARLRYKY
jgi:hypothetical protein